MSDKKLLTKIEQEYNLFFLEIQSQSKAEIFNRSAEIERKKRIYSYLKKSAGQISNGTETRLLVSDNLLSDADRYAADHQEKSTEDATADYVALVCDVDKSAMDVPEGIRDSSLTSSSS